MQKRYVWYGSYGSNLNFDRFKLYIVGGTADFVNKEYLGCSDKSLPLENDLITIPYEMYFAKSAKHWENKAIAFINPQKNENQKTFCRIYKITFEQFEQIVIQENGKKTNEINLSFDLEKLTLKEFYNFGTDSEYINYGKIINLGVWESIPMFTFTTKTTIDKIKFNKPSRKYLQVIKDGLLQTGRLSENEIDEYLQSRKGNN